MSMYSSKIGNRIRMAREEKEWRQEDLAERIGKTSTFIGMVERGERMPKMDTFIDILSALNVSADIILCDVVEYGYKIRISKYEEQICKLERKEQEQLYSIIDAYLDGCK